MIEERDTVVIGAGPGGYVAALRLGQLKKDVLLVDKFGAAGLGGVCLHDGCIPSKAFLTAAQIGYGFLHARDLGWVSEKTTVDFKKMQDWKQQVVDKLDFGIQNLCKKNNVEIMQGKAWFEGPNKLRIESEHEAREIIFRHCIIDAGTVPNEMPGLAVDNQTVLDSTGALALTELPKELVVIGAGTIAIEMATFFAKMGSTVSIVQRSPRILNALEEDIASVISAKLEKSGVHIFTNASVEKTEVKKNDVKMELVVDGKKMELRCDKVLVALGRKPNTAPLHLENTKILLDESGFVRINDFCQTSEPAIFAVGDITGPPLLAHRASAMGKVAAEVIAGENAAFDNLAIPNVVYCDPEIATVGLNQKQAAEKKMDVLVGQFPFSALGRALASREPEGFVRVVAEKNSHVIVGFQMVGSRVSELIGTAAMAIEFGCQLEDVSSTIFPHPTFSEAILEACEDALKKSVHKF
ncbi:MAG: dihydrolipoyl dehydrogenase [Candidatus Micrarchaeota archaeon]